jgi:peptidoglycan/xylan/chitin deacetylase (PgdA/CDA1 family)
MKLALRIEVATARGIRIGVPNLLRVLAAARARARFYFNMGPDRSGRILARMLRPTPGHRAGWMARQWGAATLVSGTLGPAPELARRYRDALRFVRDAGFEVGLLAWDHAAWRTGAAAADALWTRRDLIRGIERFTEVFGAPPAGHAAPLWQMNVHAWRLLQQLGFRYGSDARGHAPFMPVYNAELIACPQVPTTWPTLDELIGVDGVPPGQAADALLARAGASPLQVWTLRSEFEGIRLAPVLEAVISEWRARGGEVVALEEIAGALDAQRLPRHCVSSRTALTDPPAVTYQEEEFLAEASTPRLHP